MCMPIARRAVPRFLSRALYTRMIGYSKVLAKHGKIVQISLT